MNTQVLGLLVAGIMGMGALAIAALSITTMAAFAWRGTGIQQGTVRVDSGHIQMGPFLFARVDLQGAGRWVRNMYKYDTLWQQVNGDCAYFLLVEKKRTPVLAMA